MICFTLYSKIPSLSDSNKVGQKFTWVGLPFLIDLWSESGIIPLICNFLTRSYSQFSCATEIFIPETKTDHTKHVMYPFHLYSLSIYAYIVVVQALDDCLTTRTQPLKT